MHQIAGTFESRARSKIKGHERQALYHAKIEAIIHKKDAQNSIKESVPISKHILVVNQNEERPKKLKFERDEPWEIIMEEVQSNHAQITSVYTELKEKYLQESPK